MATRAQVAYLGEDMDQIITAYNHYDGYPENLGVALKNHFNDDSKAKDVASLGYISYLDPEDGRVEATHKERPTIIKDGDLDTLLRLWFDHSKASGAEYAYLWNGRKWCAYKVPSLAGQDKFVNYFMSEIDSKSDLNENKDLKRWAMLAGLPKTDKTQLDENIVGMEMIGNIFDREKEKYEDAFEYFLAEKVEIQSEDRKAKEYIQSIEDEEEREEEKERMFDNDTAVGKVSEGQPTVFDDESMNALRDIILKYVEDPDDAEKELDMFDYGGYDAMSPEIIANLDRDPDFKAWYNKLHSINEFLGGNLDEALNPEVSKALKRFIKGIAKKYDYSEQDAVYAIMAALKQMEFDGINETQLNEYTDNKFTGKGLMTDTPAISGDELRTFQYYFPMGAKSRSEAVKSLLAHDESGIKARMGRYAPMFAHVQSHDFQDDDMTRYRAYQTQYYNNNFADTDPSFNPRVTKLTLFKLNPTGESKEIGSMLVKTDEYIKDLEKLDIIDKRS